MSRFVIKQGSPTHKNWLKLRDTVLGGLTYSWCRQQHGYIIISIEEDLTKLPYLMFMDGTEEEGVLQKGKGITTGNFISVETFISATSHDTLKNFVNNVLNYRIFYMPYSDNVTTVELFNAFRHRGSNEGFRYWWGKYDSIQEYLKVNHV